MLRKKALFGTASDALLRAVSLTCVESSLKEIKVIENRGFP